MGFRGGWGGGQVNVLFVSLITSRNRNGTIDDKAHAKPKIRKHVKINST